MINIGKELIRIENRVMRGNYDRQTMQMLELLRRMKRLREIVNAPTLRWDENEIRELLGLD